MTGALRRVRLLRNHRRHQGALGGRRERRRPATQRPNEAPVASTSVFTVEDRDRLRDGLISAARADARISAAALIGSSAFGREDRWSDIDLGLCIAGDAHRAPVIADWSDRMYGEHAAVHHLDIAVGEALYRVFLLPGTLQVDLSFWPATEFRSLGPNFRLLFGTAAEQIAAPPGSRASRTPAPMPSASELIGMGWLYALHARSSIARGRVGQAEYMISGGRDHVLALACLRHGLPVREGRGIDSLPRETLAAIEPTLLRSLEIPELKRALVLVAEALLVEARCADPELAERLAKPLRQLVACSAVGQLPSRG